MSVGIGAGAFTDGLMDGLKAGSALQDSRDKNKLKQQMQGLSSAEVVEQPDGTYALTGPGEQPGFFGRLMGKQPGEPITYQTFNAEPTAGLVDAARQGAMAKTYASYGDDPYKGVVLDRYAADARTEEIARITSEAVLSGDFNKLKQAYQLVDDGQDADFEELPNGHVRVFDPRTGADLMTGPKNQVLAQLQQQLSPETVMTMRQNELKMQDARLSVQHKLLQIQQAEQQLNGTQALTPEQQRMSMVTAHSALEAQLKRAREVGDAEALTNIEREMQALEDMMMGRAGVGGGGQSSGSAPPNAPPELVSLVDQHARRVGLDPAFVRSLVTAESAWDPSAVSEDGAFGLMQIMPATAAQPGYGVTPMRDRSIEEQTRFGTDYLAAMWRETGGDPTLTAAAYNAGLGAVQNAGGVPNFAETQNYVRKVVGGLSQAPAQDQGLSYGERLVQADQAAAAAENASDSPGWLGNADFGKAQEAAIEAADQVADRQRDPNAWTIAYQSYLQAYTEDYQRMQAQLGGLGAPSSPGGMPPHVQAIGAAVADRRRQAQ